ncbi:MAG: hypothetical protein PV363_14785, partial [Mumia sp.]|nr:hypothetical protein [Mumia sp.]
GLPDVIARFDALLRFASLRLGRQLGTEVVPVLSRKEQADPALRAQALTTMLCQSGQLSGAIRIPDTVGQLVVTADLRASKVTCHVNVDAPREGRPSTRVKWLVRQLKAAPDSVRVETFTAHARGSSAAELLGVVRADPTVLVVDPAREIRSFRLALISPMGTTRGRGRGSFIDSVLKASDTFYADVLQYLKPWAAPPPKLRPTGPHPPNEEPTKRPSLSSTDYSSQDGTEAVEPTPANANQVGSTDVTHDDEAAPASNG